jgi:predicted dithiol-disulfide oxidoreductase (DUF899 family)
MSTIREGQSADYRKRREELLEAETALLQQRERVAELRRSLPEGARVEKDYVFREGPTDLSRNDASDLFETSLSSLFGDHDELIVQHMMFAPDAENGCPMCSMWVDGIDGIAHHLNDRLTFAVVARAPVEKLRAWGRARGWRQVRLLSSSENTFNADFGAEISSERQLPGLSVFTRNGDEIRHFYTSEGSLVERHHRAMDLFTPVWNLLDLLPRGREDWMPSHFYRE